jgi:hypothetical protein
MKSTPKEHRKLKMNIKILKLRVGTVAYACNPRYSGGDDQERSAQIKS